MKLSTMYAIDSLTNANGKNPVATHILQQWEYDVDSMQFFRSSTNFVYMFRKEEKPYFLRFAASSERTRETIKAEIDILNRIDKRGVTVASPVLSKSGNFVETVTMEDGTFHAVVFTGLRGTQFDIEDLNEAQFREWGVALGKLHSVIETYTSTTFNRSTWKEHLTWISESLSKDEPMVRSELEQIASSLNELPITQSNYGLIHFDFELDNLCWQNDTIGILDFDDCSYWWYVADIAFALRDLFEDGVDLKKSNFLAFVRGYREQHVLDDILLSYLPMFIRFAKLLSYTKILRAVDIPDSSTYPEWLRGLRLKLINQMKRYKVSLESYA